MLWLAYDLTGETRYREAGEAYIASFAERAERRIDVGFHDLGFLYSLSCVAPWRITGDVRGRRAALLAADLLMERFLPAPGIFQAWGTLDDPNWRGSTIVDSLMNMPLLHWASQETGDGRYGDAALRHARQVAAHFIRPDNSTFHVYFFDPSTGQPRHGSTEAGAADDSCWARGQAWGIYGFVLSYRYARDPALLDAARRLADYFLAHLPADKVPYWDLIYSDGSGQVRDSSAAAIAACGLLEITRWLPVDAPERPRYRAAAEEMLAALAEHYVPAQESVPGPLLLHVYAGHRDDHVKGEGSLWGDYFYLEGLTRLAKPDWVPYW